MSFNKKLRVLPPLLLAFHLVACTQPPSPIEITNGAEEQAILQNEPIIKRPLNKNEIKFYTRLYHGVLDTVDIQLYVYEQKHPSLNANVIEGDKNIIRIYGRQYYSDDYTKEKSPILLGLLAAQTMHLLQHQFGWHRAGDQSMPLGYNKLHSHKLITAYDTYEQIAMMGDYIRFTFHPKAKTEFLDAYGPQNCTAQEYLRRAIEMTFPNATAMREEHQKRYYTENEKALALGIFGDQISNVGQYTINHQHQCNGKTAAHVVRGDKTDFYTWQLRHKEADYTTAESFSFGLFGHEITHLWQNQHNHSQTRGFHRQYRYPIDLTKWEFTDYHIEQQAAIIEDYLRYYLHAAHDTHWLKKTPQNLLGLKTLVENQFPMARRTREYFESHDKLPHLKTVQKWLHSMPAQQISPQAKANALAPAA